MAGPSSFKDRLKSFAEASDIHGMKFFASSALWRKLFWAVIIVLSVLATFFLTRATVTSYLNYEYKSVMNLTFGAVPVPRVVICTGPSMAYSPYKVSIGDIVNAPYMIFGKVKLRDACFTKVEVNGTTLRKLKPEAISFFEDLLANPTLGRTRRAGKYLAFLYRKKIVKTQYEFSRDLDIKLNHWRLLVAKLKNYGSEKFIPPKEEYDIEEAVERIGKDFKKAKDISCNIIGDGNLNLKVPCNFTQFYSISQGICFSTPDGMFDDAIGVIFNLRSNARAIKMMPYQFASRQVNFFLEEAGESYSDARMRQQIGSVPFGMSTRIIVKKRVEVSRLGPPYKESCGEEEYDGLPYTRSMCIERCVNDVMVEQLGCKNPWMAGPGPVCRADTHDNFTSSIFDPMSSNTRYNAFANIGDCQSKCPPACKQVIYIADTVEGAPQRWSGTAQVVIRTGGFTERRIINEKPKITAFMMLAELGGMCGLFIGISIVTIIHFFEFILSEFITCCSCCRKSKQAPSNKVVAAQSGGGR